MNEMVILKIFILNKDIYNKYINYINKDYYKTNYNELYKILLVLINIYNNKEKEIHIGSLEDFKALFYNSLPSLKRSESEAFQSIFDRMAGLDVSTEVIDTLLQDHKTRYIASELAQVAWDTSTGQKTLLDLSNAFQSGLDEIGKPVVTSNLSDEFVTDDIEELLNQTYSAPGLKWRLITLRKMMGSLRKGNFGFIFSRPESGKTTLLADMGSYFAHQLERPYLHCNNEEFGFAVKIRYIQAALGCNINDINLNRQKAYDEFMDFTKGNVKLLDRASLSRHEIEDVCAKLNPGMIVIDSIDKIKGFDDDRDDLVYKKIYAWARELSKQYGPVIGACHASAGAEGKEWLEMDDVAYAKCMDPETEVLLHSGELKKIKDVCVGEKLMGPDSKPRTVLSKRFGVEEMFKITHKLGGDSYIVNKSHILTLRHQKGKIVDLPLTEYLKHPNSYKGIRSGYELREKNLLIDPYWLGLWLGDGHHKRPEITTIEPEVKKFCKEYANSLGYSYVEHIQNKNKNPFLVQAKICGFQGKRHELLWRLTYYGIFGNKDIPLVYLMGSKQQRLQLLAGLLDSDGHLDSRKGFIYYFSNKNIYLVEKTKQLALSCGFFASITYDKQYGKVSISGDLSTIPCKVKRKIVPSSYKPKRGNLASALEVQSIGVGPYCGVTLDGDCRYLIKNCIVTHNTAKQGEADWILGIGRSYDNGKEFIRSFHLPKNKLMGDSDFLEEFRHGKVRVQIQPDIARYEDIMFVPEKGSGNDK